ncbi:MAG: MlaD family protein [Rhizobiaceae bacterium]|nr:MlaD family protein [Rhizobiaceae bacterium]MCV0408206.1 MlaD family protein [Rhizobiaceae bacterium]
METRANYVAVGVFTLVAILAAFAFVYWTAGIGGGTETAQLRFRIPGSASGLGRGSAVLFNGVKVGDVTRVYIDANDPGIAIADSRVDRITPITASTTAVIGIAGLTGQANIEIKGGNPGEPSLFDLAEEEGKVAEIIADPSAVTNLLQTAQDIFTRADSVLGQLEGFVQDARGPLTQTVENVQTFSDALGRNADGIDRFLENFGTLSDSLGGVSERLDTTLEAAEELIRAVDREKVATIVNDVETFTGSLRNASAGIDQVLTQVTEAAGAINRFSQDAAETISTVEGLLDGVEPGSVARSIANIEEVSTQARTVVDDVSKVTSKVGERAEDIDQIIADARELSGRLNQATVRIDTIMANVDTAVSNISTFSDTATGTAQRIDRILDSVDPEDVRTSIDNIARASETARQAVEDVSKVTTTFGERSKDIDQIITDSRLLAERLSHASIRVDGVLAKIDSMLGSGEAEGLIADASETLASFRQVADTLNARLGTITDGLARFSGQGLRDVEGLVRDARRSISRIERAVTDLERNPQRIITGGEGRVREYDGRTRR